MRLYATVSSERATTGQGGNKQIEIVLQADAKERKQVARLLFAVNEHVENAYFLNVYTDTGMTAFEFPIETKGKREKGETIPQQIRQQLKEDREQDAFNAGMQ